MARPIKNNADYFSHDADMRDDPVIKAARQKFGIEAYAVYCMFLEMITDAENFQLEIDYEIIAGDFRIDPEKLQEICQFYISKDMFQTDSVGVFLTCETLVKRFDTLLSKRKRDRNGVIASDNTQSKVKESKGEKSKVKEEEIYITIGSIRFFDVMPVLEVREAALNARQKEHGLRSWKDMVPEWLRLNVQIDFKDEQHVFNAFSKYIINNGKPKANAGGPKVPKFTLDEIENAQR